MIEAENDVEMTCQCCEVGSFIVSGRLDCDHCTISGIYITRLGIPTQSNILASLVINTTGRAMGVYSTKSVRGGELRYLGEKYPFLGDILPILRRFFWGKRG